MKKLSATFTLLLASVLFSGCAHQAPPEEVAKNFWQAVVANDLETAKSLVAKDSLQNPDLLGNKDEMLKSVEIGTATTNESSAEVATTLIGMNNDAETRLPITTFLVKEDEAWKVDGQQSVNALVASSVNQMMSGMTGDLSAIGEELSKSITSGLQEFMGAFSKELPTLRQELNKLSDEEKTRDVGRQLGELFSQGLSEAIKEFNSSLETLGQELENSNKQSAPQGSTTEQKI